jgi:hypothetical protein
MQNNEKGRFFFILYTQQPQQQQQQISVKGTSEQSRRFTVQDVFGSGEFAVYTIPPPVDGIPFFFLVTLSMGQISRHSFITTKWQF